MRESPLPLRSLFLLGCAAALALGCGDLSDRQIIAEDVSNAREAVRSIRRCNTSDKASARPIESIDPAANGEGVFSGTLGIAGVCTEMGCGGDACCNGCRLSALLDGSEEHDRSPWLRWESGSPFNFSVSECGLERVKEELSGTEVVVRGRLETTEDWRHLHVADICRVK